MRTKLFSAASMAAEPTSLASAGPEERLLLWLCGAGLRHHADRPAPAHGAIDWRRVAELAQEHRVVPLIWHNLSKRPEVELPDWLVEEFRATHRQNALHGLQVTSLFIRAVSALSAAGIPSLPLKGVCLAARYYDNVAARYAGDIDLLVAPRHVTPAGVVLRENGFLRTSGKAGTVGKRFMDDPDYRLHTVYVSRDGTPLELHFQLHNNAAILPVVVTDLIAAGPTVKFGGTTLPVMQDDLQFVFLATHGARHEWVRLQWVCDIAVMLDQASPVEVQAWLATAERYSLINPVVQAMMLARRLLGSELLPEIDRKYGKSYPIRFLVRRAERSMFQGTHRVPPSFDVGRRFYRMCITGRPAYIWHELRNGMRAVTGRFAKPPAVLS
jgi:hypothetical protein